MKNTTGGDGEGNQKTSFTNEKEREAKQRLMSYAGHGSRSFFVIC